MREALEHHAIDFDLIVREDGESAIEQINRIEQGEEPCPDIVLLDLNLPRRDGRAVLQFLRKGPICGSVPVIVVTSSNASSDRQNAAQLGANLYFCKPSDYDEFLELGRHIKRLAGK